MSTFAELILSAEVEQDQAIKRRERALTVVKLIHEKARSEARARLSEDEDTEVANAMETHTKSEADLKGVRSKLAQLKIAKAADEIQDEQMSRTVTDRDTVSGRSVTREQVVRIGKEERTYNPGVDRSGAGFLRDVVRKALYGDLEAEQRLTNHMREERTERGQYLQRAAGDATTSAFAGLTVPQYLTSMYAPATSNLRPFADICNKHDLPGDGMTVNISRITTATSVALQATELAAASATSIDDTLLTENVQTAAGQQLVSRQAIDRGTGIEGVILDDLYRRYAATLDSTLLNQATTGLSAVAQAVTYTDTTPTTQELWPKLHNALANSEAALLGFASPDFAVMHSRRWYWLQSQVGTAWPFLSQPGIGDRVGGANLAEKYGAGARGVLPNGLVVIVDNNIGTSFGTNEDEIYVVASDECHLWEDPSAPVFIRAEQPAAANLGVLLVLYGYFAYSFRRYTNGQSKIGGSGLILPTF